MSPVAVLEMPSQDIRQIVLSGATGRTLAFGPGHVDGSTDPGADGVIVVAGHRDTHFSFLERVVVGDRIRLTDKSGRARQFKVDALEVADSRKTNLRVGGTAAQLVLVTCYPFDAINPGGPLRYVVTASLDASEAGSSR